MQPKTVTDREFSDVSYARHAQSYSEYAAGGSRSQTAQAWLRPGTINAWRFERMYVCADPLLDAYPGAHWLTVGDGRYGMDAMYLKAHGARVLASDISDTLLAEAKAQGLIDNFRKENAEALSFPDASFDFVFCKESYHHFPRPMHALHEMLRAASRAVLLIEPNDQACPEGVVTTISRMAKNLIKRILSRPTHYHDFEEGGNYVYSISRREMQKVALGVGLRTVAFKGVNDYYMPGVEFEPAVEGSALFRQVSAKIARYDLLCRLGVSQPGLLAVIIFKSPPSGGVRDALRRHGYDVEDLPENPYLTVTRTSGT
jgi:ubiquinone/menaquinone biosynthesis C-methylase UbiE